MLAVAERLGYAPNPAAQALESGRSNTVALVVPDITNPYFAGVIKGAERAAARAGLTLVLADTQESPAQEQQLVRRLGPAVDGFVLTASRMPDTALRATAELNRVVLVNRACPGLASVVADYDAGHPADRGPPRNTKPRCPSDARWSTICREPDSKSATTHASPGAARLTSTTGLCRAASVSISSGIREALSTKPSTAGPRRRTSCCSWPAFSWVSPRTRVRPAADAARSAPLITPAKYGLVMSGTSNAIVFVRPDSSARAVGLGA